MGLKCSLTTTVMSKDYKFNLGQLSIYANQEKPAAPKDVVVKAKRLQNAQEAEALLQFKGSADADYYETMKKMVINGV